MARKSSTLVYLVSPWKADGRERRAAYESLEAAVSQAEHDLTMGIPVARVEDEDGVELWKAPA